MIGQQSGPVPPLPGVVQRRLAHAARRARRGLPSAHDRPFGAAGGAGDCVGRAALVWPAARSGAAVAMRRSCLPAREGLRFGWQNPKEWRGDRIDSRTLILGRGAAASARSNPRDQEKERYLAHSNAKTARWSLAGIFPEKMSSPQEHVCSASDSKQMQ